MKPSPLELKELAQLRGYLKARLVWESNRTGNWELFGMDLADPRPVRLTKNDVEDHHPIWSADGKAIYFDQQAEAAGYPRIVKIPPEGGEPTVVVPNGFHPSLTGDGKMLFFVRREKDKWSICRKDLEKGQEDEILPKALPYLVNSQVEQPSVSPDGKRLAYYSAYRGNHVRAVNVDGSDAAIIGRGSQPDWSPDGLSVAWVLGAVDKIYANRPDGKQARALAVFDQPWPHMHFPRWANDPDFIVFAASASHDFENADYEIFLKGVGKADERAVRLTFHTATDRWPDLFIDKKGEFKQVAEGLEVWQGWKGAEWANETQITTERVAFGNAVLSIFYRDKGKGKAAASLPTDLNLSKATHMMFDALNESSKEIELAVAFATGEKSAFIESKPFKLTPGKWTRGLAVDLNGREFKSQATNWEFRSDLADRGKVKAVTFLIYNAPAEGRAKLDAIEIVEPK